MPGVDDLLAELQDTPEEAQMQKEEPAQETEQEPVQEAAPQPEPVPQPETKMVPLQALQEARWEQKQMKDQLRQMEERLRFADELKAQIEQIRKPKVPEYNEDPLGHQQARIQELDARSRQLEAALAAKLQMEENARQQASTLQAISNEVAMNEAEFAKAHPDYHEAFEYVKNLRTREYAAVGVTNPQIIAQELAKDTMRIVMGAKAQGQNPAAAIYNIAKTYGYQPKQQAQNQNTLNTVAQAQAVSRTLSGTGKVEPVNPKVEDLLKADGDDFDRMWEQVFGKKSAY